MHRSLAIVFLGLAFIIAGMMSASAGPNSFKIGYLQYERVLLETPTGKRELKKLQKLVKKKQTELDKQKKKLFEAEAQLQKQASVIKPAVIEQRKQQLQKQYVQLQETYVKLERELVTEQAKLQKKLAQRADPIIKQIAKSEGYDMIIDSAVVRWADGGHDLTDKVMSRIK